MKYGNNKIKYELTSVTIALIIVSLLSSCVLWLLFSGHTIKGTKEDYISYSLTEDNLFENAGDYIDDYVQIRVKYEFFFRIQAILLKFDYTEENYMAQKEYINNSYSFLDEPVLDNYDSSYIISQNEFDIGDWQFRVCADGDYPKEFRTIGFNEKSKSIVYIDFDDPDLDYLCETYEPMEECFIDEYVGYDFRR